MRERNSKVENILPTIVQAKKNAKVALKEEDCLNRAQRRAIAAIKRSKK
jgi:hypothetical protein